MNSCSNSRITGCQFTLFPMSDDFIDLILSTLNEVDTSSVWKKTDDVSTCIRGKMVQVFDVTKAIFLHAAKSGEHIAMTGTFSIGCPGDSDADAYMNAPDEPVNMKNCLPISQLAGCKIAIYPLGNKQYMDAIYNQIDLAKSKGIEVSPDHYATRLDGDVKDIFHAMHDAFNNVQQEVSHVTMTFTISANSPSTKRVDTHG
ncbi:YkoF family thiamine/hydroxymethylpyrimidine-binding protein [Virgibacillus siamensis]|uniref:YkoF family thiamine/hydroxymethylpyrimidine-binding protein n=1 Tax=Virgibacillus siamensis TaxID=480071 RepID=UPI000987ACDB|nr:YkoF family thiamine/hydroxymethylpyrimidine-binding protein [Virgibacillus siamensis]